jgi:hypothetical protein
MEINAKRLNPSPNSRKTGKLQDKGFIADCKGRTEEKDVNLYRTNGIAYSIAEFADRNMHLLSGYEQESLNKGKGFLKTHIPKGLEIPVQRNKAFGDKIEFVARSNGYRSAYDEKRKIKFKGCNPHPELGDYLSTPSDFGDTSPKIIRESWGVIEAAGVMREIMAISFLERNNFPNILEPLCVYEYIGRSGGKTIDLGYCLVERSRFNVRLGDLGGDDAMKIALFEPGLFKKIVPKEEDWLSEKEMDENKLLLAKKHGIGMEELEKECKKKIKENIDKPIGFFDLPEHLGYLIKRQTDFLINLHFRGFLRGSANGHQGNTIILPNGEAYLCDFDSTRIIRIPKKPDKDFMMKFFLSCAQEVIESDFTYLTFVEHEDLSETYENQRNVFDKVYMKYLQISGYFYAYMEKFLKSARSLGWDIGLLDKAAKEAERTHAYFDALMRNVRNSYTNHILGPKHYGKDSRDKYKGAN